MKSNVLLPPLFFLLILTFINPVFAETENFNLMNLPNKIAEKFGITVFVAKILLSTIVLCLVLFPVAIFGRRCSILLGLTIGLSAMGFLTAIGWFPVFLMLIACLLIALMYADRIKGVFT